MSRKVVVIIKDGKKKMGRPTSDPKTCVARLRLTENEKNKLDECRKITGYSISEILKMGLDMVYNSIKN